MCMMSLISLILIWAFAHYMLETPLILFFYALMVMFGDVYCLSSINGIVRNAKTFASSGYDDPDLIDDAKSLIERFSSMVKVINALNK